MKNCSKCNQEKTSENFAPDKRSSDGRASACRECYKRLRTETAEKIKAQQDAWRERNAEHVKRRQHALHLKTYPENRERLLTESKTKRDADIPAARERERQQRMRRRQKDPASYAAKMSAAYRRNRSSHMAGVRRYQARKQRATQVDNDPRITALYFISQWLRSKGDDVHVDHIIPLSKGGPHTFENLQILPAIENLRKGARLYQ